MRLHHLMLFGLTIVLAACDQKAEIDTGAITTAVGASTDEKAKEMGDMDIPAESGITTAKGSGTVTAIDNTAGTITLDHGPIPEANWPAMTMRFTAKPALLEHVKVGDKVTFDLTLKGGAGEVTAISNS
jgi:Cu/Ag efflux protein CusF